MALLRLLQKQDEVEEILKLVRECAANFLPYSAQMGEVAACTADVGRQFLALKMPVQARRVFEEMFHLRHDNVDVYMELSDYFMEQGHVSRILKLLLEVSKKVKDADLMFKIGQILLDVQGTHMSAGKVNRTSGMDLSFFEKYDAPTVLNLAHKVFQQGLLLEPDNTKCWLNIVRCHLRRSQRQEAEEALNRVLQRAPNNPKVLEKAIEVTLDEQAYDFAASWLKHALKQFPKELAFFRLSARYHQEQGRTYDAIGYLKRALALDSRNGELFIELGELYEEAGEYSDAMVYLENAGRLLPDDPRVQQGIKRVLNSKYGND
jgi:tetratricopeptide (TPR) repeat protein